jgi:DNA-binding NtrC family response regulator
MEQGQTQAKVQPLQLEDQSYMHPQTLHEPTIHKPIVEDTNIALPSTQSPVYVPTQTLPHPHHIYDDIEEVTEDDNLNLRDMEKRAIISALQKSRNRRKIAAEMLGISERTLYRKIIEYGIEE